MKWSELIGVAHLRIAPRREAIVVPAWAWSGERFEEAVEHGRCSLGSLVQQQRGVVDVQVAERFERRPRRGDEPADAGLTHRGRRQHQRARDADDDVARPQRARRTKTSSELAFKDVRGSESHCEGDSHEM